MAEPTGLTRSSELMDTCSRLREPRGVGWKHVNFDHLRTMISGKQSIWWLRVAARSGRWPRNLACAIPFCAVRWNNVGSGGSRRRRRGAPQLGPRLVLFMQTRLANKLHSYFYGQ